MMKAPQTHRFVVYDAQYSQILANLGTFRDVLQQMDIMALRSETHVVLQFKDEERGCYVDEVEL